MLSDVFSFIDFKSIALPSTADLEFSMQVNENYACLISKFIGVMFECEEHHEITFNCSNNGIDKTVIVESNTSTFECTITNDKLVTIKMINNLDSSNCLSESFDYEKYTEFKDKLTKAKIELTCKTQ